MQVANMKPSPVAFRPVLMPERDLYQLLAQWNQTEADYRRDCCIQNLFEQQVTRTPDRVAVSFEGHQLTYSQLNARANQLANYLIKFGVGPEVLVGISLERSLEMLVGLLGILKAGGAYVPLDPAYPRDRLALMCENSQLKLLLSEKKLIAELPLHTGQTVLLDGDCDSIAAESTENPTTQTTAENLAYVLYTSGSAGKPKGVQIEHRSVVNFLTSMRQRPGLAADDALLAVTTLSFDIAGLELYLPLTVGARVVIASRRVACDGEQLLATIEQSGATVMQATPVTWRLLLDAGWRTSNLKCICGGEALPRDLARQLVKSSPSVWNLYGPTETTIWSCIYKVGDDKSAIMPIGRPIANTQIYILDSMLQPVPIGEVGELYIGGDGLARGYLNRPELTADRFILNPFRAGTRLYKTGDLARYLPSGDIEFLGRIDHQVKIRGVRIELEEIESVITEFKGVRQAVVSRHGAHSDTTLVAYLVTAGPGFDTDELQNFLRRNLPEVMIPAVFVLLKNFPLMPNGKVDRYFLPPPLPTTECVPPKDEVESRLVQIWESILAKNPIGVTTNFFDLGGHSLLVVQLMRRIERLFGKKLSLSEVFEAPTIQQLAATLRGPGGNSKNPAVVPIQPYGTKPPLFWVRGGPLLVPLAHRLGSDQPLLGLDLPPSEASQLPVPYKLEDIAAALVRRMREVQPEGPYYVAGLCVNGVIAYEMASQLTAQGEQVALLALFDAQNPEYYRDFSRESRGRLLLSKIEFHLVNVRRLKTTEMLGFTRERWLGIRRRLKARYWYLRHASRRRVDQQQLQDLDTIVHPASYFYHPKPYPGRIAFFQSTNWPVGRYWEFYTSWTGLMAGGLQVHYIAGGHESMFRQPNVDVLGSRLEDCLSEAQRALSYS
jgi:amino acid adenylation domain-containing protein